MVESRTSKSLKNAKVVLAFYVINLSLQFFSRKVFLDYLGTEILGLNTTVQNLLGFLNIAELGIGIAISYALYKPLFEKDRETINDIVSIQGWLYRKVAYFVIVGSCIFMLFFPLIFKKVELPLWYIYSAFIVFLVASLLGYFVNYRQIVLVADQKEYKVTYCVQGGKAFKYLLQILALIYLTHGYVYWMIIELLMSFAIAYVLNIIIKREYVWLVATPLKGKYLQHKYPEIITKTKQLFFHKIASFALEQTSPLIIYAYASLTMVAMYGNYMAIIWAITLFVNSFFNGMSAGVGNIVAEGNKNKVMSFYWECVAMRYWLISILCFCLLMLTHSFIELWIGEEYILPQRTFILMIAYVFINCTRVHELFVSAYGIYQDIWAPIIEAAINIGCSILFGYYWGLSGIVGGVVLSLFLIVFCWKPYFLFRFGFKESVKGYIVICMKYLILIFMASLISYYIVDAFHVRVNTFIQWGIKACLCGGVYLIVSIILFFITDFSFRLFSYRLVKLVNRKM